MAELAETIGIETESGLAPLIAEGTELVGGLLLIRQFSTAADAQPAVTVRLLAASAGEAPPRPGG